VARETGNLKNKQVQKLIRAGKPGKHYDGRGLRLEIKGASSASWVTRYQIDGVIRYMGLGSAFDFTLAEARERNRKLARQKIADGAGSGAGPAGRTHCEASRQGHDVCRGLPPLS
jgi:Arm DNA-binding domain